MALNKFVHRKTRGSGEIQILKCSPSSISQKITLFLHRATVRNIQYFDISVTGSCISLSKFVYKKTKRGGTGGFLKLQPDNIVE